MLPRAELDRLRQHLRTSRQLGYTENGVHREGAAAWNVTRERMTFYDFPLEHWRHIQNDQPCRDVDRSLQKARDQTLQASCRRPDLESDDRRPLKA